MVTRGEIIQLLTLNIDFHMQFIDDHGDDIIDDHGDDIIDDHGDDIDIDHFGGDDNCSDGVDG